MLGDEEENGYRHPLWDAQLWRELNLLALRFLGAPESDGVLELQIWNASQIRRDTAQVQRIACYEMVVGANKAIVGTFKFVLLFLDVNDWVCSINIGGVRQEDFFNKHFLIPFTLHGVGEVLFRTTVKGIVAFVRREELVVFRGGIDFDPQMSQLV